MNDTVFLLKMKFHRMRQWLHKCPECGARPDKHWKSYAPRHDEDNIIASIFPELLVGRCGRCGARDI